MYMTYISHICVYTYIWHISHTHTHYIYIIFTAVLKPKIKWIVIMLFFGHYMHYKKINLLYLHIYLLFSKVFDPFWGLIFHLNLFPFSLKTSLSISCSKGLYFIYLKFSLLLGDIFAEHRILDWWHFVFSFFTLKTLFHCPRPSFFLMAIL